MAHTLIAAIRSAGDRPAYIVHSHGDRRISVNQAHELAAAALDAEVDVKAWFPERSEHLQTPALYPDEFERRLVGFFKEAIGH